MNALFLFICTVGTTSVVIHALYYIFTWISSYDRSASGPAEHDTQEARMYAAQIRAIVTLIFGIGALSVWLSYTTAWGALFYAVFGVASFVAHRYTHLPKWPATSNPSNEHEAIFRAGYCDGLEWAQKLIEQGEAYVHEGQTPYRTQEVVNEALARRRLKIEVPNRVLGRYYSYHLDQLRGRL